MSIKANSSVGVETGSGASRTGCPVAGGGPLAAGPMALLQRQVVSAIRENDLAALQRVLAECQHYRKTDPIRRSAIERWLASVEVPMMYPRDDGKDDMWPAVFAAIDRGEFEFDTCLALKAELRQRYCGAQHLLFGSCTDTDLTYRLMHGPATPYGIFRAAKDGDVEKLRRLLDAGADINALDIYGNEIISLAVCGGHVKATRLLLERGASWRTDGDGEGEGLRQFVVRCGTPEMLDLMLETEPVDARNGESPTLLQYAVWQGGLAAAKTLAERGADVNATDASGRTLLQWALQEGNASLAVWLLDAGASATPDDLETLSDLERR